MTSLAERLAAAHAERPGDFNGRGEAAVLAVRGQRRATTWTAVELLATKFPAPRWAVPGTVPEGLTLLAGAPKLGKSWLALGFAVAVASGGRALGSIPVEQGGVCYLALEDPPRRLQQRLRSLLGASAAPESLYLDTEWPALSDGGLEQLDRRLAALPGTRLVVVDVWARFRGPVGDHGSVYSADYAAVSGLKQVADRHSVALLVVHHVRKAGASDFLDTVSGTHGLAGAADSVLVMTRARNSGEATLSLTGRDVEETELAVRFAPDIGTWTLLGSAEEYGLTEERRRVRDLLTEAGPLTPKSVADKLGIAHENAKKLCRRMADAGQLDVADGYYTPISLSPLSPVSLSGTAGTAGTPISGGQPA